MDIGYFQKINNTYGSKSKQEVDLYLLNRHVDDRFADTIDYRKRNDENNYRNENFYSRVGEPVLYRCPNLFPVHYKILLKFFFNRIVYLTAKKVKCRFRSST